LTVTLDNVQVLSVTLNLEGQMQLGGTNNDSAYLGFSSGTGALAEKMDVLNWTFSPNPPH
jgi:hypothetical protein